MAYTMVTNDEIRTRFKALIGKGLTFESVNDMATKTGVEQGSLQRFLKQGSTTALSLGSLLKILEYLGGRVVLPGDIKSAVCDMGDYALIPKVAAKLGAGSSIPVDEDQIGLYAFRKDFLRRIGLDGISDVRLFDVMGSSMEPTIQHKDTVLVALRDKDIISGQIYAIRVDDEIQIKRIIKAPGQIIIRSDNREFQDYVIDADDEAKLRSFGIIGRVRWQGRVY